MLRPISSRMMIALALALPVLQAIPLIVIARVAEVSINWFYLLLVYALSTALTGYLLWHIHHLQQQRARLRNRFNHFVHELKSPLTAVTIGLEGLRDEDTRRDPALSEEYLSISLLELERLTGMVENALRLFNYDQPGATLQLQPVNPEKVILQALKAVQLQAKNRNATISVSVADHNLQVHGDRMHLVNAVVNLLDNALKYSPDEPRITVRLEHEQGYAVITVQDKGLGIAAEHQPLVFDKHFRAPGKKTSKIKGHGLGLHYVAWVARKHLGEAGVESSPGQGSRFWMRLPADKPS